MIQHPQADDLYNRFADFEASFAELSGLIADSNGGSEFNGHQSLHLFWQYLAQLNQSLYLLLGELTKSEVEPASANCGAAALAPRTADSPLQIEC